jgi:predicted transcriptional regulator
VVQTIVQKLGYTDTEVRNYVATDKSSFVGVLYQKLLEDQNDRKLMMEKQSQLLQHQLQIQNLS